MRLASVIKPDAGRRLSHCCAAFGISYGPAHSALHDARAAAQLFGVCWMAAKARGFANLSQLGCTPDVLPAPWCDKRPSRRVRRREDTVAERPSSATFLSSVLERVPAAPVRDPRRAAYMNVLDRVLDDRVVTADESDALLEVARQWGLQRAEIFDTHLQYLEELVEAAVADHVVTPAERQDLDNVAALLGLHASIVDASLERHARERPLDVAHSGIARSALAAAITPGALAGMTVCFTGTLSDTKDGIPISRAQAAAWATSAGLFVRDTVTKKLDVLVLDDLASQSTKARKARQYGIRMLSAAEFWAAIGVTVDRRRPASQNA